MAKVVSEGAGGFKVHGSIGRDKALIGTENIATLIRKAAPKHLPVKVVRSYDGHGVLMGGKANYLVAHVYTEPSADHLASIKLPDWLTAPAGAPDEGRARKPAV